MWAGYQRSPCESLKHGPVLRIIADEATYVATIEQIALSTRYLVRNDATLRLEITEEFLGFVEADKTTGEALAITFINAQEAYGILVVKRSALSTPHNELFSCRISCEGY